METQKEQIKNKIILHKNNKINVLSTFWNLNNNEREYLFKVLLKTDLCICPVNALDLTNKIREVLKE